MPVTSRTLLFSIKYTTKKPKKIHTPPFRSTQPPFYCGWSFPLKSFFFHKQYKKERTYPLFLLANGPTFVFFNIAYFLDNDVVILQKIQERNRKNHKNGKDPGKKQEKIKKMKTSKRREIQ